MESEWPFLRWKWTAGKLIASSDGMTRNQRLINLQSFGKISQLVAKAAHGLGLTDTSDVKSLSADEADKLWAPARVFWGTNARGDAQRATRFLGWSPKQHSVEQEIPTTVKVEATRLGKL